MAADVEFSLLENKLESLLKLHYSLNLENQLLRQKLSKLTQERAELIEKNKKAAVKVKRIMLQLRDEIL
jgi:uncharacterized protein (TIGR02449 family)